MKIDNFFNFINQELEQYEIEFKYDVADGVEVKSNFKYIQFNYTETFNTFSFEIKNTKVLNGEDVKALILLNEISSAREILEKLNELRVHINY